MTKEVMVDIKNLTVDYVSSLGLLGRRQRRVRVLEDFNLQIHKGETIWSLL